MVHATDKGCWTVVRASGLTKCSRSSTRKLRSWRWASPQPLADATTAAARASRRARPSRTGASSCAGTEIHPRHARGRRRRSAARSAGPTAVPGHGKVRRRTASVLPGSTGQGSAPGLEEAQLELGDETLVGVVEVQPEDLGDPAQA